MKFWITLLVAGITLPFQAHSEGDLTRQTPIVVEVELGTTEGEMRFSPSHLEFETGKLYRLVLINNSPSHTIFPPMVWHARYLPARHKPTHPTASAQPKSKATSMKLRYFQATRRIGGLCRYKPESSTT